MHQERFFTADSMRLEWRDNDIPQTCAMPHCYDYHAVYCLTEGAVLFHVEGSTCQLNGGSAILLPQGCFHSVEGSRAGLTPGPRQILYFKKGLLRPEEQFLLDLFQPPRVLFPDVWESCLRPGFERLERCAALPEQAQNLAIRTTILTILLDLYAISDTALSISDQTGPMAEVLAYISANLTQPMTLDSLAGHFFLSRNTLERGFKRATGTTLAAYILYKRMALARILLHSGHPAADVAQECGYTDYSTFYRSYKKVFGQSPAAPISEKDEPIHTALMPGSR